MACPGGGTGWADFCKPDLSGAWPGPEALGAQGGPCADPGSHAMASIQHPAATRRGLQARTALLAATGLLGSLAGCGGGGGTGTMATAGTTTFTATSTVSNSAGQAANADSNLVNPWGLAYGPATRFWLADQGSGLSTVYDGAGHQLVPPLVVSVPRGAGSAGGGPTGVVFNGTADFQGDTFIFATLDGTLSGWSAGTAATLRVDHFAAGAAYTGLARATAGTANYLYAANFAAGAIEVFDAGYAPVDLGAGTLADPAMPAGYAPFNVQNLGGRLYVTYASRTAPSVNANIGAGLGYVDVFNPDGSMAGRLAGGAPLNAPWGLAMAPAAFTPFGGALLVGNLGDGRITAFNAATGAVLGQLAGAGGAPLAINGLWAIAAGNDANAGSSSQLYYTAGPQAGAQGLFGSISASAPAPSGGTGGTGY
jgi:uncharacterized protein (TIGR03118 family)